MCGFPAGRYYIGKHTHHGDLSTDKYTGSGVFCYHYFKKYGKINGVTYLKEIIEINPSKKINSDRELFYIGNLNDTDPLCMNLAPGKDNNKQPVLQYSKSGKFIKRYDSIFDAYIELEVNNDGTIGRCCRRRCNAAYGYIWRYESDPDVGDVDKMVFSGDRRVMQYDLNGNFVKCHDSLADAGRSVNAPWQSIQRVCKGKRKTSHGYI